MRRVSTSLLTVSLAALALAGCGTLEPAYHRPALPTPDAFPNTDQAAPAATPVADIAWRDFVLDPKLRSVVEMGLANNRDLRVAVANVEAARAQYRVQRADLFPHVNATAGAVYGREPLAEAGVAPTPGGPTGINEHLYTASVGVNAYELDLFGKVRSLSKAALEQYLATAEARRAGQITVVSEIATDYVALAADEAILKTAQDTLNSSLGSLDLANKRFKGGIASELDVAQARTLADQARADVANDTTVVAQDRNALNLAVGAPVSDDLLPAPLANQQLVLADLPAGVPSQVLLARPDVLQAEDKLKAGNAQIGAARAAFFPSITLTGSAGAASLELSSLFSGPSRAWSFSPQINLPIFAGGANRANLDLAKANRKADIAQYEKAIQTAFSEVANGLARQATIDDQLSAEEAGVNAATLGLKLAQARYERGSDTYLNVLIAQRTLYAAQQLLIRTQQTKAANLISLYAALGGGADGAPVTAKR